jgi:hypothetical protein
MGKSGSRDAVEMVSVSWHNTKQAQQHKKDILLLTIIEISVAVQYLAVRSLHKLTKTYF